MGKMKEVWAQHQAVAATKGSIDDILNTEPAFGFDSEDIMQQMANLFRRRSGLEDNLNFELIKGAYLGFLQVEEEGRHGVPVEVLQRLNTADIVALYYGINALKGSKGLAGVPFGKLISRLVGSGYNPNGDMAHNAIRAMNSKMIGFSGYGKLPSIEERMSALDESLKIQFLRSFFTPVYRSQENNKHGFTIRDTVYDHNSTYYGRGVDSNKSREDYVREFAKLIKTKLTRGNDFDNSGFMGWIVPSSTNPEAKYFVQRKFGTLPSGPFEKYNCSCPHGIRGMYGGLSRKAPSECKHIGYARENLSKMPALVTAK